VAKTRGFDDHLSKLREYVLEQFKDVPMPSEEEIYDPTGFFTDRLRGCLAGKPWQSVNCDLASTFIRLDGELSALAYRYYVQSLLLCKSENGLQGCYPEEMGICRHDLELMIDGEYPTWAFLRSTLETMIGDQIMTRSQVSCLALHVQLYCMAGDSYACRAYMEFWEPYSIEHFFEFDF
jgi:hypothetical protein